MFVFSIKLIKSIVFLKQDACVLVSTNDDILPLGPSQRYMVGPPTKKVCGSLLCKGIKSRGGGYPPI